ncbi:MAG: hypothetical protein IPK37_16785 [Austwickia sp.]|nr:MAG: hypothetical protein IPK37_16785 [Austwickia sp.]
MKADREQQLRLLDLQGYDTRLGQIRHRSANLPEQKALDAVAAERTAVESDLIKSRTQQSDIARDVAKAEADVQLVRDRAARNRARLDAGTGTAKELTSLQHELDSLARRQAELEDEQLEIMERAEGTDALVTHLEGRAGELATAVADATSARDAAMGTLAAETAELTERRLEIVPQVATELMALYEKIREQTGMGAAAVVQRRCEGCRLELMGADVARIAAAPADEVLRCEECRRILVRTDESGL